MKKVTSIPSRLVCSVDIPEVSNFSAEFIYNYYMSDESLEDYSVNGGKTLETYLKENKNFKGSWLLKPGNRIATYLNKHERIKDLDILPRYVHLRWIPSPLPGINKGGLSGEGLLINSKVGIDESQYLSERNIPKIVREDQFAGSYYTSLQSNNGVLVQEMSSLFDSFTDVTDKDTDLRNNFPASTEEVKKIFDEVNDDFHATFSAQRYQKGGIELQNEVKSSYLDKLKSTKFHTQINNNFLYDLLIDSSVSTHPNNNNLNSFIEFSRDVKTITGIGLKDKDYETSINYVDEYQDKNVDDLFAYWNIVGYVIDKTEVFEDGSINKFKPIIIHGGASNNYIDYEVRYGAQYFYNIRTIMQVQYNAIDNETLEFKGVTSLIASKDIVTDIQTIEHVAPPTPADIRFTWDYDRANQNTIIFNQQTNEPFLNTGIPGSLLLSWTMPVNSQMDIKKFQIFRRKTINDPFELIRMFDFDDSKVKFEILENKINSKLISMSEDPILLYYDDDFYKNSEYIYAFASIDAHGLSSNYSEQFKITFNKFTNKLEKSLVSIAGAPKPYPNMYLEKDLFVDTVKVSYKNKMSIYLNPDCIKIKKGDNAPENILLFKEDSNSNSYVINVINTDVQKSKQVNIEIKNIKNNVA